MSSSTDAASMPATRWDCGKWGHDSQLHPGLLGVRRFCPGVCVHSHDSNVLMCGRVSCFVQLSFCFSGAFPKHIQLKRWHAALQLLLAAALAVLEQPRHGSSKLLVTPPYLRGKSLPSTGGCMVCFQSLFSYNESAFHK